MASDTRGGMARAHFPLLYDSQPRLPNETAMHFLLFYTYVPDILERRPQFRGAHIRHARESVARGELVLGGALADPVDLGVLFFSAPSKDLVEAFARVDPYVTGGLVTE